MQNLILFQTVTNWDWELGSGRQKKMKNKGNLIHADEFSFHIIQIISFYQKSVLRVEEAKEKMQNWILS